MCGCRVRVVGLGAGPMVDLRMFSLATHFIGNCVSSFTSFGVRDRARLGLPSAFWGLP